jgi:predicted nucleic acid-binding Zn ribbon protein
MKKCRYCGKELNSNFEFCSNECENSYRKIIEKDRQKIKYFMIGIILGFLVMFYGIISNNNVFIIGIGIVVMGIDVVLLPFTTPETINFLGYQKSKFAGRISGILLIAVGVWMCFIQ